MSRLSFLRSTSYLIVYRPETKPLEVVAFSIAAATWSNLTRIHGEAIGAGAGQTLTALYDYDKLRLTLSNEKSPELAAKNNAVKKSPRPRALAGLAAKPPAVFLPDDKAAERFLGVLHREYPQPEHAVGRPCADVNPAHCGAF